MKDSYTEGLAKRLRDLRGGEIVNLTPQEIDVMLTKAADALDGADGEWNAALEKAALDLDDDREAEVWINPVDPSFVLKRSATRIRGMKRKERTTATHSGGSNG